MTSTAMMAADGPIEIHPEAPPGVSGTLGTLANYTAAGVLAIALLVLGYIAVRAIPRRGRDEPTFGYRPEAINSIWTGGGAIVVAVLSIAVLIAV